MTKKYVLRNVTLLRGRIALCVISSWPVVKFVHGYLLLNVAICMVAKHGVLKQKRCMSLMSAGVKQSASSGIYLTPQGQGFCQGLSGQPHCVTRSCVHLKNFIMEFHKVRTIRWNLSATSALTVTTVVWGTIGENVECISRLWNCSYDYLCENTTSTVDIETSDRVRAIKELIACKDNGDHLPIYDSSELSDLIGEIACY